MNLANQECRPYHDMCSGHLSMRVLGGCFVRKSQGFCCFDLEGRVQM